MSDWITLLLDKLTAGIPVVRMVVATVRGSAPREPGATLLYWVDAQGRTRSQGSIGGGHLEMRAMEIASHLLNPTAERRHVERFSLGASLGQCCGGAVELYWERFDHLSQAENLARVDLLRYCVMDGSGREWFLNEQQARETGLPAPNFAGQAGLLRQGELRYFIERLADDATPLWLYGAGHVGRALVQVLADLPFRIHWVDSRPDMLDEAVQALPRRSIATLAADDPAEVAATAPANAWHLVMTHSHEQDLRICEALLGADRFDFLGLIGSRTKEARFRHRLLQKGYPAAAVARITCPIGLGGIRSKLPAAIAVAVAGELLEQREQREQRALPKGSTRALGL
ncbi:MAG: xanthine dehydrogenase accessory protein XdhC [Betaproteobacteria bacterium]|nr:xanthine dehydrogenase accessory protein XdhC [Betaproteobacteria bacterium]